MRGTRWLACLPLPIRLAMIGPAKVLCRVPERSHHHLDRTRAPHGMTRGPRRRRSHLPGCIDPLVSQHCLVDFSQRSTKLWAKARRMKHVPRVKYGGLLAVAYDEHRHLILERTTRKWKNSVLRYRAECKWRCASVLSRESSEACGPSAAEHSPRGCSTGASGAGSARCEHWSRLVDSNRVHAPRPSGLPSLSVVADGAEVHKGPHTPPTLPCCRKLA
jgi:hypothetical protein